MIGSVGLEPSSVKGSAVGPELVGGFLVALVFFWCLRVSTALIEYYITIAHSRKWIYWPHGIALALTLLAISGDSLHPSAGDRFANLLTVQAVTYATLTYLLCALLAVIPAGAIIFLRSRLSRSELEAETLSRNVQNQSSSTARSRSHKQRHYGSRHSRQLSRDAAAFALSIVVGIASVIQGLDFHHLDKTLIAIAAGGLGLYLLTKLPRSPDRPDDT